jgi:chorismate mutase
LQDVTTAGAGTDLDATHLVSGVREADGRSPVPLVAVGLLMVTTTLTTLCLRRRMAMAADSRTQAVHSASERYPLTRKVPERSLR